jgi:signal transduction histidine kinase
VLLVLTSVGAVVVTAQIDDSYALDWGVLVLMLVISPVVGELLRTRRDELASLARRNAVLRAEQEHAIEVARLIERQRIARELHDVVTHNVTMLVVQAEAAASVPTMSDPDRVATLDAMAAGGRLALAELRQLLGVLRDPDDASPSAPLPGIAAAAELVERARRTGLDVQFHGPASSEPLPAAVDLAAYRVIQEGLTNVVRHASATHAAVAVEVGADALVITIDDDGVGGHGVDGANSDGVGLTGLRERVRLLDGALDAGPRTAGGFRLSARIPLGAAP